MKFNLLTWSSIVLKLNLNCTKMAKDEFGVFVFFCDFVLTAQSRDGSNENTHQWWSWCPGASTCFVCRNKTTPCSTKPNSIQDLSCLGDLKSSLKDWWETATTIVRQTGAQSGRQLPFHWTQEHFGRFADSRQFGRLQSSTFPCVSSNCSYLRIRNHIGCTLVGL